jgi:hypothetical protein
MFSTYYKLNYDQIWYRNIVWIVEMTVMALGETCWNNEGGFPKVVSQTKIDFVYKKLNTFRTTTVFLSSSFLYSWRCTSSAKYIEFLYKFFLSLWNYLVIV